MYKMMLSFLDGRMEICNYLHFLWAANIASVSLREGTVPPPTVRNTNDHQSINKDDHSAVLPVGPPTLNLLLLSKQMRHQSVLWVQPGTQMVNLNPPPISTSGRRPHESSGDATSSAVSSASAASPYQAQRAAFPQFPWCQARVRGDAGSAVGNMPPPSLSF